MGFLLKYNILTLSTLLLIACSSEENFNGSFKYLPEIVTPGTEITVKYNADSSNLAGKSDIKLIAYLYKNELINTVDIPLSRSGNIYSGQIKTDENTLGIICKFLAGDEIDNNDKEGYVIFLNSEDGNRIPGSLAGYGAAINRWGSYYVDIDRDKEKAFEYLTEDIKNNPSIKIKFLNTYFEVLSSVRPEDKDGIIQKELDLLSKTNHPGEEELSILTKWYDNIGETEKSEIYKKELLDKYPACEIAEEFKIAEFKREKDIDKKIDLANKFIRQFPSSENKEYLFDLVANSYRDKKEYSEELKFLSKYKEKPSTYRFYSVVSRMLDKKANMNTALSIATLGVERAAMELNNPSSPKPNYLSESEWLKDREYYLGLNYYGRGEVLYNLDKRKEAVTALEKAVRYTKEEDELINEFYSKCLVENGKYDLAMSKISNYIKNGHSTIQMKAYLREAYLNEKGTEDGFETLAEKFEDAAKEKLILKLRDEMMLEPAPDFTLTDLNVDEVSLSQFKGDIVILDFWATWCGPCKASFPGMKKAIEKYIDDDKVKFLFVNSWERVAEKKKNAEEFIVKNEYPFRVLMDEDNKVIEKYKVSGIPTKFIIDGEGNIRFKAVGFQGSDDKLVEEISTMISMVR